MGQLQRKIAASERKEISYKVPTGQQDESLSNNNDQMAEEVMQPILSISKFDNELSKPLESEKKTGMSFQCVSVLPS
jgi:hypothetical protein